MFPVFQWIGYEFRAPWYVHSLHSACSSKSNPTYPTAKAVSTINTAMTTKLIFPSRRRRHDEYGRI